MKANHYRLTILCGLGAMLLAAPAMVLAYDEPEAAASERNREYQMMLEEAERARAEAEQARREAVKVAEQARAMARREALRSRADEQQQSHQQRSAEQQQEMERAREELSRAHRELREASREIAEAHRQLARSAHQRHVVRQMNLGKRAVLGVALGRESEAGVEIVGVSPGGPAERAGLQTGDLLVSIQGERLDGDDVGAQGKARKILFRVMEEVKAGETLSVTVLRDGEPLEFEVTAEQREPSSWQTMIRIPGPPPAPGAPDAPQIVVEHLEIPQIDEDAIVAHVRALEEELKNEEFRFLMPDGKEIEMTGDLALTEHFDIEVAQLSELADHALREANVWFGLPQAQGLELAAINEGLGAYFKTDRGVLVLQAREDNAYQLLSGDVVLEINASAVDSPTDLMRALREIEPGSEVDLAIKRDRRNKTLKVVMPENRLGHSWSVHPHIDSTP